MATSSSSDDFKPVPYDFHELTPELKKKAKLELFEDEDTKTHSLRLLKSMLREEQNLRFQNDDDFLICFLRTKKYDVKRAFNLVKTFYSVKSKHDELYGEFTIEQILDTLGQNVVGVLPYRDYQGCVILVLRAEFWNPHKFHFGDQIRALTAILLYAIRSPCTQVAGFKVIVDCKGFSLSHVPHVSPKYLWLLAEALQNCFPARFKGVHIVNEGYLFTSIWNILKTFLMKKITDRFHFHGKHVNKLHKYFSPAILPSQFEGKLPPFNNDDLIKKLKDFNDYIHTVISHGYVKPKRKKSGCLG